MIVKPNGDRVYVKLEEVEEGKIGHVLIPAKHHVPSRLGIVKAVGDEVKDKFKVGDKIMCSYLAGVVVSRFELDEPGDGPDVHRILSSYEIMAIIE